MQLGHDPLTLEQLAALSAQPQDVTLHASAMARLERGRAVVDRIAAGDTAAYGINTGFGALAEVRIDPSRLKELQRRLLLSHAAGVGNPLSAAETRALILLRALVLATGTAGVRPVVAERLLELYRKDILPIVPEKGSVGASGDLAPLAHLALALIGEGEVMHNGARVPAQRALAAVGLSPLELGPKEGLALVNGTQAMSAVGGLAVAEALRLAEWADAIGAMSLEGMLGSHKPFDARIHAARPHPGQIQVATRLRALLTGSEIERSHVGCAKVQDAYSFRCMPQVHGATRDTLAYVRTVLETEIRSATDNPLVFPDGAVGEGDVISGGNFHGQPVALALDFAAIAVAELASISERRVEQLLNPSLSGLPAFLTEHPGENSGFMMAQVTQASLVNENKVLAHPASVDTIPGSASREDHVSMGMTSARKLREIVKNVRHVLGIELLAAAQAIELRRPLRSSAPIEALHTRLRQRVPKLEADRYLAADIAAAFELLGESAS
jgi:histidine ammonia-lyase